MKKIVIDKDNKTVIINLNTKFYPSEDIFRAAQSFSDSCWVNIGGDPTNLMQVTLTPKSDDIELHKLGYEFYSYVLGMIKTKTVEKERKDST